MIAESNDGCIHLKMASRPQMVCNFILRNGIRVEVTLGT